MRLDTACIVAPKPKVPSMPTRRAFLLAGSTFVVGACVGGAAVHALHAPVVDEAMTPTGNAELDELRRLAVRAPIDELLRKGPPFLMAFTTTYPEDAVLWRGVLRMSDAMVAGTEVDRKLVGAVIDAIKFLKSPEDLGLQARLPKLHELRNRSK